jgi:hypothetical protein
LVLVYSSLFILFTFAGGGGGCFSRPGAAWIMLPGGWLGESLVVHDAHLFVLQIHAHSFELAGGEKCCCFSYAGCKEVFHRLGVQKFAD